MTFDTIYTEVPYHKDPLSLYQSLTGNAEHTMLLESAEIESKAHLQSIIMPHSCLMIQCDAEQISFSALTANGLALLTPIKHYFADEQIIESETRLTVTLVQKSQVMDEDQKLLDRSSLDGLRALINKFNQQNDNEPMFIGGVLAFDLIATSEPLPTVATAENDCPDYLFYVAETLIKIDHTTQKAQLTGFVFDDSSANHDRISAQSQQLIDACKQPLTNISQQPVEVDVTVNISDESFKNQVNELKQHIIAGDVFQVVPSRCFSLPCPNPLGAYRTLKQTNPSPYMFYFNGNGFTLFGASPESAVKYDKQSNQVEVYPIAGTRPRGKTASGDIDSDLDSRIELELRLDQKELSEHLMLVDLARNDVARISETGTRKVAELLKVDRYSHVMHLVSRVTGQLKSQLDALHAYQACMNMGTLTGAPKVRATQLIREVEQQRRGSYGGAVGYLNSMGDMDTCIVIRSAYVKNNVAHIQAGAGVVFDSDPQSEADETRQKAQAVITAIKTGGGQ